METRNPEEIPQRIPTKRVSRSFFTKKLERKFGEKELEIPQQLLCLMDLPFEQFSPEDKELYETKIKPLTFVFVEHLMEVYEVMGKPKRGWEEMLERVDPSPIKVLATLVIHESEKVETIEEDIDPMLEENPVASSTEKFSIRSYNDKDHKKERWWERKIF